MDIINTFLQEYTKKNNKSSWDSFHIANLEKNNYGELLNVFISLYNQNVQLFHLTYRSKVYSNEIDINGDVKMIAYEGIAQQIDKFLNNCIELVEFGFVGFHKTNSTTPHLLPSELVNSIKEPHIESNCGLDIEVHLFFAVNSLIGKNPNLITNYKQILNNFVLSSYSFVYLKEISDLNYLADALFICCYNIPVTLQRIYVYGDGYNDIHIHSHILDIYSRVSDFHRDNIKKENVSFLSSTRYGTVEDFKYIKRKYSYLISCPSNDPVRIIIYLWQVYCQVKGLIYDKGYLISLKNPLSKKIPVKFLLKQWPTVVLFLLDTFYLQLRNSSSLIENYFLRYSNKAFLKMSQQFDFWLPSNRYKRQSELLESMSE